MSGGGEFDGLTTSEKFERLLKSMDVQELRDRIYSKRCDAAGNIIKSEVACLDEILEEVESGIFKKS